MRSPEPRPSAASPFANLFDSRSNCAKVIVSPEKVTAGRSGWRDAVARITSCSGMSGYSSDDISCQVATKATKPTKKNRSNNRLSSGVRECAPNVDLPGRDDEGGVAHDPARQPRRHARVLRLRDLRHLRPADRRGRLPEPGSTRLADAHFHDVRD